MYKKSNFIIFLYLFFLFGVAVATYIYGMLILKIHPHFIDQFNNMDFSSLPFDHEELTLNLINTNQYFQTYDGPYPELGDLKFYTGKYPLVSITISSIAKISENYYFIIIVKNLVFFSIVFWISYNYSKYSGKKYLDFFVILTLLFYNPYNFHVASAWYFEDFACALLLPSLYLILVSKSPTRYLIVFYLIIILFFSKSSMTIFCFIFPLIIMANEYFSEKKVIYLPILATIFCSAIWGGYSFNKTGYFAFFLNNSSFNQKQLSIAQNDKFHKIYPHLTIDTIQHYGIQKIIQEKEKYGIFEFKNEWDFHKLFKIRNKKYIEENLDRVIKDAFMKFRFIFFEIYEDARRYEDYKKNKNKIDYSMILNRLILNFSILLAIINLYKKFKMKQNISKEIYFIFILGLIIPLYLIGWATSKHLVGISNTAIIYLFAIYNHRITFYIEKIIKKNFKFQI